MGLLIRLWWKLIDLAPFSFPLVYVSLNVLMCILPSYFSHILIHILDIFASQADSGGEINAQVMRAVIETEHFNSAYCSNNSTLLNFLEKNIHAVHNLIQ